MCSLLLTRDGLCSSSLGVSTSCVAGRLPISLEDHSAKLAIEGAGHWPDSKSRGGHKGRAIEVILCILHPGDQETALTMPPPAVEDENS